MDNRKKIVAIISAVIAFFIVALVLVNCFSSKERYFEEIAYSEAGIARGIGEIFDLDGNKRYYKIVSYGGKVLSVSFHDFDGTLRPIDESYSKIDYEYNPDGALIGITKSDSDGKILKREKISAKKKKQN